VKCNISGYLGQEECECILALLRIDSKDGSDYFKEAVGSLEAVFLSYQRERSMYVEVPSLGCDS